MMQYFHKASELTNSFIVSWHFDSEKSKTYLRFLKHFRSVIIYSKYNSQSHVPPICGNYTSNEMISSTRRNSRHLKSISRRKSQRISRRGRNKKFRRAAQSGLHLHKTRPLAARKFAINQLTSVRQIIRSVLRHPPSNSKVSASHEGWTCFVFVRLRRQSFPAAVITPEDKWNDDPTGPTREFQASRWKFSQLIRIGSKRWSRPKDEQTCRWRDTSRSAKYGTL